MDSASIKVTKRCNWYVKGLTLNRILDFCLVYALDSSENIGKMQIRKISNMSKKIWSFGNCIKSVDKCLTFGYIKNNVLTFCIYFISNYYVLFDIKNSDISKYIVNE